MHIRRPKTLIPFWRLDAFSQFGPFVSFYSSNWLSSTVKNPWSTVGIFWDLENKPPNSSLLLFFESPMQLANGCKILYFHVNNPQDSAEYVCFDYDKFLHLGAMCFILWLPTHGCLLQHLCWGMFVHIIVNVLMFIFYMGCFLRELHELSVHLLIRV